MFGQPSPILVGKIYGDIADGGARGVVHRTHLVDEQERIDEREAGCREGPPHHEAAALELAVGGDDPGDAT